MQLLKHVANAMQRTEGFVLERALVSVKHSDKCDKHMALLSKSYTQEEAKILFGKQKHSHCTPPQAHK